MASQSEDLFDYVVNKGNGVRGLSQRGLKAVPKQYIQPPVERLDSTKIEPEESIPIIDVSKWDDPKVAKSICDAASKWGFFYIINHGMPLEVLDSAIEAGHRFFELPVEERRKYLKENSPTSTVELKTSFTPKREKVLEWKDMLFHVYDPEEGSKFWPPVSKNQVLDYMKWAKPLIRKLLEVLMKGLNVQDIDETKEYELMGTLIVDLIYYPICPSPELTAGSGRHSDVSTITILLQDDTGGLYVRGTKGDTWIPVKPIKGALVINIGDVLQIMSNDRYKSIEHRVIANQSKNRVSVPIFVNPGSEAVIGPLTEALESGEKPLYKQVSYSEYFSYFFSKSHDGKQTMDFAKI